MYMKLITALALIGLTNEHYRVDSDPSYGDYKLTFCNQPDGVFITITITTKVYAYPDIQRYFVNYSNKNGDFTSCMGTPHIEQVIFDLASVMAEVRK